jgi:pyrroline-5-carboxylate reductase
VTKALATEQQRQAEQNFASKGGVPQAGLDEVDHVDAMRVADETVERQCRRAY